MNYFFAFLSSFILCITSLFGQRNTSEKVSKNLCLFNGNVFNGNVSHLNSDSVYLLFTEPHYNAILRPYFPDAEGIIFIYSKSAELIEISGDDFERLVKNKKEKILYKLDSQPITSDIKSVEDFPKSKIKSIIMIQNFSMKNETTGLSDLFTLFLINGGSIYQRGITNPPKVIIK